MSVRKAGIQQLLDSNKAQLQICLVLLVRICGFVVTLYQQITDPVKFTGREEHIGELPGFAGTPYLLQRN